MLKDILEYATTARQKEIIGAILEGGTHTKAAKTLGISRQYVDQVVQALQKQAAKKGYAPEHDMTKTVPDGYLVKGVSTYYDQEGVPKAQWVKSAVDRDRQIQLATEAAEVMAESLPKLPKIKAPKGTNDRLLAVYPMGDPHFGMYSYAAETGADFDVEIARTDLCGAVAYLVDQAPPAERALIANLGDFFHADNVLGITTRSGNVLDMDTRMSHVVRVGVSALRQCIDSALTKHKTVHVINAIGNHDDMLSQMLSVMFAHIYENEPRVIIEDGPTPRHYIQHGKVMIGVTHGHNTKDRDLPGIMATERAEQWGQTKHRYFYRGHHHQDAKTEYNGCLVEMFRTLAAGDAYAVGKGYLSGRDMKCIVHHADFGEVYRTTCNVDMLR